MFNLTSADPISPACATRRGARMCLDKLLAASILSILLAAVPSLPAQGSSGSSDPKKDPCPPILLGFQRDRVFPYDLSQEGTVSLEGRFYLQMALDRPLASEYISTIAYTTSDSVVFDHLSGGEEGQGDGGGGFDPFPHARCVVELGCEFCPAVQGPPVGIGRAAAAIFPHVGSWGGGSAQIRRRQGGANEFWEFFESGLATGTAEVRQADGTIAVFESYSSHLSPSPPGTFGASGFAYRLSEIIDPFDNVTDLQYDTLTGKLAKIVYPNGVEEIWGYSTETDGFGNVFHWIDVTYQNVNQLGVSQDLSWAMLFEQTHPNGRPWDGARLSRIYRPKTPYVEALGTDGLYDINAPSANQISYEVYEFGFQAQGQGQQTEKLTSITQYRTTTKSVDPITDTVGKVMLEVTYQFVANEYRVATQTLPEQGQTFSFQLIPFALDPDKIEFIIQTSPDGTDISYQLDVEGRPISVQTTPENNMAGRPRHNDPDNGNLDPTHVISEPASLTTTYEYQACSCPKPTRILEVETGRETTFTYDSIHGRVLTKTATNPSNQQGQPATVTYTYTYTPRPAGVPWSALHLESISGPDGTWDFEYEWQGRAGYPDHGRFPRKITVNSPPITRPGVPVAGMQVQTETHFNVSTSPYYHATALQGQVVYTVDGDGVPTKNIYAANGFLLESAVNPAMGSLEVKTTYQTDDWGRTVQVVEQAGSPLARTITLTPDVHRRPLSSSSMVDGVTIDASFYRDRWENLSIVRRTNRDSSGGEPEAHGGTQETARAHVRDEFHFIGDQLQTVYSDRRPLDRDSNGPTADDADARMLKSVYLYDAMARLITIGQSNGSSTELTYDGYGTLYKVERLSPDQTDSVLDAKYFVNASLDPVTIFRGSPSEQLWTVLQRNLAGMVTQLTEPVAAAAPQGYDQGSLGGAVREYTWDPMGRLVEEEVLEGPTTLARTEWEYDEMSRRVILREHVLGAGSGTAEKIWLYFDGKATELEKVTYPGTRWITYQYDGLGRLSSVKDSLPNPNEQLFDYYSKSWHRQKTTRKLWDDHADSGVSEFQSIVTEFVRDNLGRVNEIREKGAGAGPDLVHAFTYYTLGYTQSYTDPEGRVEKYLPDALGRLVQRAKVGAGSEAILNDTVFTDWTADGRTKVQRTDDKGNETRSHHDFAGRLFLVQNPGADYADEPSQTSGLHKQFQMYGTYDEASRLTDLYTGNSVHTRFFYDGPGRLLVRETPSAGLEDVSFYASRDVYRRDALGRVFRMSSHYGPLGPLMPAHVLVDLEQDSVGRMHKESYRYGLGGPNQIDVVSTYSGGDPFRTGLAYKNNLDAELHDLSMEYTADAVGRMSELKWRETGGALDLLVKYSHMGNVISHKEVHYGQAVGLGDFSFDDYGRLSGINHTIQGQGQPFSEFDYVYDKAGNLLKEVYEKQGVLPGAGVGDRFTYDEYNRLAEAWMGVDQATMDAPEGQLDPNTSGYIKLLTYDLDDANNRQKVWTRFGSAGTPSSEDYTTQDGPPQGPSNRYATVAGVALEHDERGNTTFDGSFYYVYDYLNRLSEVYQVTATAAAMGGSTTLQATSTRSTRFSVNDMGALRTVRESILAGVRGGLPEIISRNGDPTFTSTLRAQLPNGTVSPLSSPTLTSSTTSSAEQELTLVAIYQYDGFQRRVVRVVIGQNTWMYAYDGWEEVQELVALDEGQGVRTRPVKQFVWGRELDELVSFRNWENGAWTPYFIAEGGAHCPARLLDEAGAVLEVQEYDPYGRTSFFQGGAFRGHVSGFGNPFQYKGLRHDAETGLLYVRNRFYSVSIGRFMSLDPLGVWGDLRNLGNGYNYAAGNPLIFHDPFGLQTQGRDPWEPDGHFDAEMVWYIATAGFVGGAAVGNPAKGFVGAGVAATAKETYDVVGYWGPKLWDDFWDSLFPPSRPPIFTYSWYMCGYPWIYE